MKEPNLDKKSYSPNSVKSKNDNKPMNDLLTLCQTEHYRLIVFVV